MPAQVRAGCRWPRSCLVGRVPSRRPFFAVPVLLAVVSFASSARADDAKDGGLERARALFDEAGELEKTGQWTAAQERLRSALRIRETANLRYALGWALENDGKGNAARAEYERARRLADQAGNAEVSRLSAERIAKLDAATTTTTSEPVVPTVEPAPTHPTPTPILPWVLVGGGGALIVTAAALLISSSGDASTRDEDTRKWCDATACAGGGAATRPETAEAAAFRRDAYDAASRGNSKQVVGGLLGGVGVVGVGVGVFMLLRGGDKEAASHVTRLRIDAAPIAGGGMAGAHVTF